MKPDDFFATETERLKAAWEQGRFLALPEILLLLSWNGRALPEWVAEAAADQLLQFYERGGGGERGRASGVRARNEMDNLHRMRWNIVRLHLGGGQVSLAAASRTASERLQGFPAQGSPGAMKDSYQLVERAIASGNGARFAGD